MSAEEDNTWVQYLDRVETWIAETGDLLHGTGDGELPPPPAEPPQTTLPAEQSHRAAGLSTSMQRRIAELKDVQATVGRQLRRVKDLPIVSDPLIDQARYLDRSA